MQSHTRVVLRCPAKRTEFLLAELMDFDHAGIVHMEGTGEDSLEVHFLDGREAERCRDRYPGLVRLIEPIPPQNWAHEWQKHWKPMSVGRRFYLQPEWISGPVPDGRILLEMRAGMAFGGGDHPTTQLCLCLLEDAVSPGDRFADIGSGTGILSAAALELGAAHAMALDVDEDAVTESRRMLARFGDRAQVALGSFCNLPAGSVDVVAANLQANLVLELAPEAVRVLKPKGGLAVSGILAHQIEEVVEVYENLGVSVIRTNELGDWAAALLSKS